MILVAGGLGAQAMEAHKAFEFLEEEKLIPFMEIEKLLLT